jgi:uncharacterized protein
LGTKSRSRVLLALVLTVVMSASARLEAQTPGPDAASLTAAEELLAALGSDKQLETVIPLIMRQTRQVMVQGRTPDVVKSIDEIMPVLVQRFNERRKELIQEVAKIYAKRVTVADMKAMTAFFSSEAGKRFVALQPELTRESMVVGQKWGEALGRQVDAEMRQELKKRGIDL